MLLFSVHNMGATLLKVEELQMEENEAKTIATAVAKVAEHYEAFPGMSEKAAAWANLGGVVAMAYAPRIMAFRMRMQNEAAGR